MALLWQYPSPRIHVPPFRPKLRCPRLLKSPAQRPSASFQCLHSLLSGATLLMNAVFRMERWSRVNICGGCEQSLDLSVQVWDTAMVRSGWEIPQARDFWGVLRILNLKLASQIVIKVYFSRQESHVEYTKQFISLTYNFRKSRLTVGGLPIVLGFPDSSVGKESACNAGDPDSIPGLGRSAGEGIGYPLQYSWASLWLSW